MVITDPDWLLYATLATQATSDASRPAPPPSSNLTFLEHLCRAGTTKLLHSYRTQIKVGPSLSRLLHLPLQQLLKQHNYEGGGSARRAFAAWHLSHQQQYLSKSGSGTPAETMQPMDVRLHISGSRSLSKPQVQSIQQIQFPLSSSPLHSFFLKDHQHSARLIMPVL